MDETDKQNAARDSDKSLAVGLPEVLCVLEELAPKSEPLKGIILETLGFEWKKRESNLSKDDDLNITANKINEENGDKSLLDLESLWQGKPSSSAVTLEPITTSQPPVLEEGDAFNIEMETVAELPETDVEKHLGQPAYISLFKESWTRGIVSSLLTVPEQLTKLDFKLLEKLFSTASPIEKLPYLSSLTLSHGVQLLLDTSESMQPFLRDETELIGKLKRILSARSVSVHKFKFNLWSSGSEITWSEGGPEFLQRKKPVLLISDFGAAKYGKPFDIKDYKSLPVLFRQIKNKGCSLYALLPTGEKNFPRDLKNFIPISFAWDRHVSPQRINKLKRK